MPGPALNLLFARVYADTTRSSTAWPCYILNKYEIGLLDAAKLAGIAQAKNPLVDPLSQEYWNK
jgi:hypothetical protein